MSFADNLVIDTGNILLQCRIWSERFRLYKRWKFIIQKNMSEYWWVYIVLNPCILQFVLYFKYFHTQNDERTHWRTTTLLETSDTILERYYKGTNEMKAKQHAGMDYAIIMKQYWNSCW